MNTGIFYQPLNQDIPISTESWDDLSLQLMNEDVNTLVVQWSSYGSETFGGTNGWLSQRIDTMLSRGINVWLGLYSDPDYFQKIHTDIDQQKEYLSQYFLIMRMNYQTWQPWISARGSQIKGVYFPLELSDYDFSTQKQREQLNQLLANEVKYYQQPIMLSLYLSGEMSPDEISDWTKQLSAMGIQVYVQDGAGTRSLKKSTRLAYLDQLEPNIGTILEIFKQNKRSTQFMANKLSYQEYREVREKNTQRDAVIFSLRYLPIAENPLQLVQ